MNLAFAGPGPAERTERRGSITTSSGKLLVALFTVVLGLITAATNIPSSASQDASPPKPAAGCVNRDTGTGAPACAGGLAGLQESIGAQLVPTTVGAFTQPGAAPGGSTFVVRDNTAAADPMTGGATVLDPVAIELQASSALAPELAAGLGSTLDSLVTSMLHAFTVGINLFAVSPDHFVTIAGRDGGSVLSSALGVQTNTVVLPGPGRELHAFADDRFKLSSLSNKPPSRPD
jgi:hypothetical protein